MKNLFQILILSLFTFSFGQDCIDGVEVELWDECYNIEETTELELSYQKLTGEIPEEIGNLTKLTNLNLGYNNLTGEIPTSIKSLINLESLILSFNKIGCQKYNFDTYSKLMLNGGVDNQTDNELCLIHCDQTDSCSGKIPHWIGDLINLKVLKLNSNQFIGMIPSEIGNLKKLTELYLSHNELEGRIPPEIGNLTKLTSLYLQNNNLTGSIPSEIGNLVELTSLKLENNNLTGSIPSEIENLDVLGVLVLNDNENNLDLVEKLSKGEEVPPIIFVESSLKYLQDVSREHMKNWKEDESNISIAITGSNGKTTQKEILYHLIESAFPGKVHATQGNYNNHIGVPLTLLGLKKEHRIAILEIGSNHLR